MTNIDDFWDNKEYKRRQRWWPDFLRWALLMMISGSWVYLYFTKPPFDKFWSRVEYRICFMFFAGMILFTTWRLIGSLLYRRRVMQRHQRWLDYRERKLNEAAGLSHLPPTE